jgi:D-amino-acid oxidase
MINSVRGQRVLVIGAGVSGLTSALCLRQKGFAVTVLADRFAPKVTSVVAGALWEWPPAVCGLHNDQPSLSRCKAWSETSYGIFGRLALDPTTGVYLRPVTFYFQRPVEEDRRQRDKMNELAGKVRGFRHDSNLIRENGVNPALDLRDAYRHAAPMIDTDIYMRWLLGQARQAGCQIVERQVTGDLREQALELLAEHGADAIVHCSGLGAKELTERCVYPVRGALVRVRNDGKAMPRITEAHCISHSPSDDGPGFLFIVPRGDDMLVLGGLAEVDEWNLDVGLHNHDAIRKMHQRCLEFFPSLRTAEIDAAEPVRVGLRPFRRGGVRVEAEPGTRIVHNYGHGGSGVTLSWGCALEVAERVEKMLHGSSESQPLVAAPSSR